MVTRLLIARHGNTFAPTDIVRRVGTTDLPLVASGLEQGLKLGQYLKQHHLLPDMIFTSELKRTKQMAEQVQTCFAESLSIQSLPIFNEIDYGMDENKPESEVVERLGVETLKAWESQAIVPPGWKVNPDKIIQDWQIFSRQISTEYPGKTIMVITSNGIARFAPYLTGNFAEFNAKHAIKIATGALCVFQHKAGDAVWECLQWNVKP